MFKSIFIALIVMFFSACSVKFEHLIKSKTINEDLSSNIKSILYLIEKNDLQTLNKKYIHNKFGFYEVDVDDMQIVVSHKNILEELDDYVGSFDIKTEDVNFYCSPYNDALYGWSQDGVFVSKNIERYLLDYLKETNLKKKKFIKQILKNSVEVIVTYNTIFYLTKIDYRYYITLIDNVKTDCSTLELE